MALYEVRCERDPCGNVLVECPHCRRIQWLPLSEEWYSVETNHEHRGRVFPAFVCMAHVMGLSADDAICPFMGELRITNW